MADIIIEDVTNGSIINNEWVGTGVFDKLMNTVNKNIELQYLQGRIKGQEYATVYLGSLQAVLAQSIDYIKSEKMIEAQIAEIQDGTLRANTQLNDELLTSAKQRELVDAQIVGADYDNQVKSEQVSMSIYERTYIQPKQLEKLESDILLSKEQEKLTYTERVGKDKEVATMGLDTVIKDINATPETIYTPKYKATV